MTDTSKTVKMQAGDQEIDLTLSGVLTAVLHQDDMVFKSKDPSVVDISPEMTIARANELTSEMWAWFREEPNFKRFWAGLWRDKPLPEVLETLASKHTAGMILLVLEALSENKTPHMMYPETYLHPSQQQMIPSFLKGFQTPPPQEDQASVQG